MKKRVNITIDENLLALLHQMKDEQDRNLSNMIECLLFKAVEDR